MPMIDGKRCRWCDSPMYPGPDRYCTDYCRRMDTEKPQDPAPKGGRPSPGPF